ncbi:hypothetical protein QQM79_15085 [Marinobacteraceae bacterium S3BR75-40.1]
MISNTTQTLPILIQPERPTDRRDPVPLRPDSGQRQGEYRQGGNTTVDQAALQRRVEARSEARKAQLERFDADSLPPRQRQALDAYNQVASQREDNGDSELAKLDLFV